MSPSTKPVLDGQVSVAYLARGQDKDCLDKFANFIRSFCQYGAGLNCKLFIIVKGFTEAGVLHAAEDIFARCPHEKILLEDDGYDIGAYCHAVPLLGDGKICFLNTNSEIVCDDWLLKLGRGLDQEGVGLVGATGSYESSGVSDPRFPDFPNVHLRSNAFMMRSDMARKVLSGIVIVRKIDAYLAESGFSSLSRKVISTGQGVMVVGRNGRVYAPEWWPESQTFRQGTQENLLVQDNVTRTYQEASWAEKRHWAQLSWGASF